MLTFISGKLFLTRNFWFWWCIGVAVWYLRMPYVSIPAQSTLWRWLCQPFSVLWFADRAVSGGSWIPLPKTAQRMHCRSRACAFQLLVVCGTRLGWLNETTQIVGFVDIWFSPQTSVSAALVSMVRLRFLWFHGSGCAPGLFCVVSSLEHADSQEGHNERAAVNPHGCVWELNTWCFVFLCSLRNKKAERNILSEQIWFDENST